MIFLYLALGGHFVYRSKMILAILLGSHLGNVPVKFESHWIKGLGGGSIKANYSRFSVFSFGGHFVHRNGTVFTILVEGHLSNIPMKFE